MKPILFNTEMVKAILDGRKTVTRRVLAEGECFDKRHGLDREPYKFKTGEWRFDKQTAVDDYKTYTLKSPYQPGDVLYVRETWRIRNCIGDYAKGTKRIEIEYRAGGDSHIMYPTDPDFDKWRQGAKWHPSIHMPKKAARLFLQVTDVRAERLQDITPVGLRMEGIQVSPIFDPWDCEISPEAMRRFEFERIWDSTIKKKYITQFGWNANPWVWVIEFERISREEATLEEITL